MKQITLNIGGQDRTFYFGLGFLGNILEGTKTNMADFDRVRSENPFKWLPLMLYYSCAYGYEKVGKELDFTLNDVIDWADNADLEVLISFNKAFNESLNKNVPKDKEDKKKVTKQ